MECVHVLPLPPLKLLYETVAEFHSRRHLQDEAIIHYRYTHGSAIGASQPSIVFTVTCR